jgi:hypothetical protein
MLAAGEAALLAAEPALDALEERELALVLALELAAKALAKSNV